MFHNVQINQVNRGPQFITGRCIQLDDNDHTEMQKILDRLHKMYLDRTIFAKLNPGQQAALTMTMFFYNKEDPEKNIALLLKTMLNLELYFS